MENARHIYEPQMISEIDSCGKDSLFSPAGYELLLPLKFISLEKFSAAHSIGLRYVIPVLPTYIL